ncbi:PEP/pyruvate-binding domain-containing protein [Micromonospora sp. CPCC 206061]|uniref:PEP/pyruvate-binding domain-containing protein n=1 Tax=Micromonospora sp. CPCC 206061 TaxID=3122410 RepID=UPI002FF11E1C
MSVTPLAQADRGHGHKASALAVLLRAGLPVPDGFVVTDPATDPRLIAAHLRRLGAGAVAVRSSAVAEDTETASFAGQLATVLGSRGLDEVLAAIQRCAASTRTRRAQNYRTHLDLDGEASAPVIVQKLVEADHAGVLFTRDPRSGADRLVINASWGLGESVVSGEVVPDELTVTPPTDAVRTTVGTKQTRVDLGERGLVRTSVPAAARARGCLAPNEVTRLVALGRRCEDLFGRPQDVEWAVRGGSVWILQSRPITTLTSPVGRPDPDTGPTLVTGVPSSPGRVRGPARLVRSVDDFSRVQRGDVLVCRTTDPAWTPLFRLAAGVVTETGGVLCHAAIVAREYRIPAVVGATGATTRVPDGEHVTIDGTLGTVAALPVHLERRPR